MNPSPDASGRTTYQLAAIALGTAVAAAVVAPLTRRGWLLLVDWPSGPHPSLPRQFWGLDGGLLYGVYPAVSLAVGKVVGHAAASWVLVGLTFPVAAGGMSRLVEGPLVRRAGAALLYCVNPFVFERLGAGQLSMLAGYAVLPWAMASMLRSVDRPWPRNLGSAAWVALATALLTHMAWITGVAALAVVLWRRAERRALVWLLGTGAAAAVLSAYLLLPRLFLPEPVALDRAQLHTFATRGSVLDVVGLYGFFRPGPRLPKDIVSGWPFVLLALLVVVALGLRRAGARLGPVALAAGMGLVLAFGTRGPFGPAYRWAAFHLPGFGVMREPQKFTALVALGYATGFGFGVEHVVASVRGRAAQVAAAVLGAAVVVAYTPNLFWGLGGQVEPVRFPAAWRAADRTMGTGPGKVLFLPWHRFMRLTFTADPVWAPADAFFRRDVLAGDNIELDLVPTLSRSPRSVALEDLFRKGDQACRAGAVLAPMGVEYVVLAKSSDWRAYRWLDGQEDLERVQDDADLAVYRNRSFVAGSGYRAEALPAADLSCTAQAPGTPAGRRLAPVRYRVEAGAPGDVLLPEPYDDGWRLGDARPVPTSEGTVAFVGGGAGTAAYRPARLVVLGWAVSAVAGLTMFFMFFRSRPTDGSTGPRKRLFSPGRRRTG